ncbi:Ig-like domain-containing protein [Streptomyces sp. NPDC059740]|uniref:L,D-transpeptidase n=1 Tax=Streptomyces sp. NPDC059740 TaxID=3346926 RepID=UPI00365155A3
MLAVLLAAPGPALTACGHGESASNDSSGRGQTITVVPGDGSRNVPTDRRIEVKVSSGRLVRVTVTRVADSARTPVAGGIAADGRSWRPREDRPLPLGSRYVVDALARDEQGRRTARHATFATRVPAHRFVGYFRPEQGSTVGTGMIVSFDFNQPITRRAEVERAITVTARPPVAVAAHWFGDRRLDFRPRERWRPGTDVAVRLHLRDVQGAPGFYGTQDKTVRFRIGRDQVSTVDAVTHTMVVRRDGRVLAKLPITAGREATPTYNGKMVVLERRRVTRMDGDTVGFGGEYDIPDVPHALRLTRSGTFLHGNYWAPRATFGHTNASHGCVGLRDEQSGRADTPAAWFFEHSLIGDTVEVVRSPDRVVAPDNGLGGWNMPWAQWRAGSALR